MGRSKSCPIASRHKSKSRKDLGVPKHPKRKVQNAEKQKAPSPPARTDPDATMASELSLSSLTMSASAAASHPSDSSSDTLSQAPKNKEQVPQHHVRTLHKVINESDIVILVLDARDPEGCRNQLIEEEVRRRENEGKKLVFVLNKIDLVPRENAQQWLQYLRHYAPTLPFRSASASQRSNFSSATAPALLRLLKAYRASASRSITIGVVGFPNVGKSSLINSLERSEVCEVAAQPGHTKDLQTVQLGRRLKIIDSPGFDEDDTATTQHQNGILLRNVVKIKDIEDPTSVVEAVLLRTEHATIQKIYGLPKFSNTIEFLTMLALSSGKFLEGTPDILSAARQVLTDWNYQKIPYFSIPPTIPAESSKPFELAGLFSVADADAFGGDVMFEGEGVEDSSEGHETEVVMDEMPMRIPVKRSHSLGLSFVDEKQRVANMTGGPPDPAFVRIPKRFRRADGLSASVHSDRPASLDNIAVYLSDHYNQPEEMTDIILGRQSLDLFPSGHTERSTSTDTVAKYLSVRYNWLGDMANLNGAIILGRQALDLCPEGHPDRSTSLDNVALHLSDRYRRLGEIRDLDEAMVLGRQALELRPEGHPDRSISLNNFALYLSDRYNRLGDMTDINQAIILGRQALKLFPSGHPERSVSLNNVSSYLADRYNRLGDMTNLNEAIILGRQALDLCPSGHSLHSMLLDNLASYLCDRYKRLGEMTDLNEAIILGRQAVDICSSGHPDSSTLLNNMANYLFNRYRRLKEIIDLNGAIILGRQALDLRPSGHPDRSMSLDNVALYLSDRYKRLGETMDLNEAIMLGRQALNLRPSGHPDRSMSLNHVALYLSDRYNRFGDITDLNEAIILGRQALDLCHPDRSRSLHQLADCLRVRFTQSGESKDREDLFSLYTELTNISQTISPTDLSAAKGWITVAEDFRHPTVLLAYETSLRLLVQHLATLPSLPTHLQIFKDLASSLGIDAFSACLRNERAKKAIELLEQGRGVFWNQIARLRSPLEEVIASGQEGEALASEFTRLSSEIHNAIHSQGSDQHDRLCSLNVDLQSTITKIRELPGFIRFMLPSSFSVLQRAASGGPVIIVNASQYTCDALVVLFDSDPVHIPLQITKQRVQGMSSELRSLTLRAKMMDVKNDLGRFLRDLWDEVVSPIVDFLQTIVPPHSRIWWCPTSEFSLLPLHAAGPYRRGQRNLSHLYISSYTPTLTALIHARRNIVLAKSSNRFLAVGQATLNGQSKLLSISSELDIVAECMQDLGTFTRLEGSESSISRFSEELRKNEWIHLACHGVPNEEKPFKSAFALHDGLFTIERIMGYQLEHPEFAYLSACHTTVGYKESPDEVIHLASAMQFAGFRSVIGTMWAVDDGHTKEITTMFYKNMVDESGCLDYTRAAFALNKTMNTVDRTIPLDQRILYVHIGA